MAGDMAPTEEARPMTEAEHGLQLALDADPANGWLRRLLADALDDVDDPRAAGYRVLGLMGRVPRYQPRGEYPESWAWVEESNNHWSRDGAFGDGDLLDHALPDEWVRRVESCPRMIDTNTAAGWREWPSRREADDAAAIAFARLPADVQAAISTPAGG